MGNKQIAKLKALISKKRDRIMKMEINRSSLGRRSFKGMVGNSSTKAMKALIIDQYTSLRKLQLKLDRLEAA